MPVNVKKLFSIAIILICPLLSNAQRYFSFGFDLTLQQTGYTSWINRKPFNQISVKPSFGVQLNYNLTEWFAIGSGLGINLYTQKRSQFRNNFTYFSVPVYLKFNIPLKDKITNKVRNWNPEVFIGINNACLLKATHHFANEKESISGFSEKYHYDLIGGVGIKIRIKDNLLIDNYVIASMGNPVNKKEYNSIYGTIINMNFGIKSAIFYSAGRTPL